MASAKIEFEFERMGRINPESLLKDALAAREKLESGSGPGSEFLGWLDLPKKIKSNDLKKLAAAALDIQEQGALVIIGIGGSYLGARAIIEALLPVFNRSPALYFAGHQLDGAYHEELLTILSERRYAINVISKSGTTLEPALAFRLFWQDLKKRFSVSEMNRMVFITTDAKKGALRRLIEKTGLQGFVIPDDVGGRYSVFSPVGLLPTSAMGIDPVELLQGACDMMEKIRSPRANNLESNPALAYACYRNAAYQSGKKIEILVSYQNNLTYLLEWWKQLFGESEGKGNKGIFPATVNLTTDLHSMGQWMQDGERIIFETVIDVVRQSHLTIPASETDDDGLNYLSDRYMHDVNRKALEATLEAHSQGDVPCARLTIPELNARNLGSLIYLFEYSCGISGYMLGVNPFDQPGVQSYKTNMLRLLGK